jgi:folate-dependent phosphoribosylglycinamide formyltransferase PurN
MKSRLVVLISGYGSNLQAILDACASGELDATVVSVISNKAEAYGLTRAPMLELNIFTSQNSKPNPANSMIFD